MKSTRRLPARKVVRILHDVVDALAYELVTGKAPFSGSSPQATLAAIRPRSAVALLAELDALPPMSSGRAPAVARKIRSARTGADNIDLAIRPRDAGPGGDRAGRMSVAPTSGHARADTTAVSREISDGTPNTAVPAVISNRLTFNDHLSSNDVIEP